MKTAMLVRELFNYQCMKTSIVVGTLFHGYSIFKNPAHAEEIYRDFSEGRYIKGTLNLIIPYLIPYSVCFHSRRTMKKELGQ